MRESPIEHVSDTAFWVANSRAIETRRRDALFHDPLAERLVGDRGGKIARRMYGTETVNWSVAIRTCIIDDYIQEALARGIDAVLNLGAGLDTRPYRMALPASLPWIEVDYPSMIDFKEEHLRSETPACALERVRLDLADAEARRQLFAAVNQRFRRVLVLTEGVVPYLALEHAAALADDLKAQPHFCLWVIDYFSPEIMKYTQRRRLNRQMRNAPFKFHPGDWAGFFRTHGWQLKEMRYLGSESLRLKRAIPSPWWMKLLLKFTPEARKEALNRMTGYALLVPVP